MTTRKKQKSKEQIEGQGQGAETPLTSGRDSTQEADAVADAGPSTVRVNSTSTTNASNVDAVAGAHQEQIEGQGQGQGAVETTVNSSPVMTSSSPPVGTTSPTSSLGGADAVAVAYQRVAKAMKTIGWSEPAALLAVLADPGAEHQVLAATYDLTTKSLTRATAKAEAEGFLVGKAGAWVVVLPPLDGAGSSSPTGSQDVRKHLADQLAVARAGLLGFQGTKYHSPLERDVAVALTGARLRFEVQQPYSSFVTTDRLWTADFVVKARVEQEVLSVVIEATGRADAAATVEEKVKVLDGAGVPYVVVRGHGDLDGLVQKVIERAKAAAAAVQMTPTVPEPDDGRPKPHTTKGGVYIDPRAVRDRTKPAPAPYVPPVQREPLPALPVPPPVPGLDLADHELRRLQELMEEADLRFEQERIQVARGQFRADLSRLRAAETHEQKKERATELLRADTERWRAEHGAAAVAERRHRAQERDAAAVPAYRPEDGEHELTGEECAEQDELPDDTEANRSE